MCDICGCGETQGHDHSSHARSAAHGHGTGARRFSFAPEATGLPGFEPTRIVELSARLLDRNDAYAAAVAARLAKAGTFTVNLLSSPGAGKTTLLVETLKRIAGCWSAAVIEGDQHTDLDATRIAATGVPAVQLNTGRGCHLDAHMILHALDALPDVRCLLIENVGNLICPAGFRLGETKRIVLLSVTEGEDKPLKYPDAFAGADLMLLTKIDLLPYVDFDVARCLDHARRIKPGLEALHVSTRTGEGLRAWLDWLAAGIAAAPRACGRGASGGQGRD
mgnify:CR=1 FL=1